MKKKKKKNKYEDLFRMSFITQDNSATTLDTNLVKIIESIIFQINRGLTASELQIIIKDECDLEFSCEEINRAIKRRGSNIIIDSDLFYLSPKRKAELSSSASFYDELTSLVSHAIKELDLNISINDYRNLIMDYIYFCFNSNKTVLLSLINSNYDVETIPYSADNQQIKLINTFLSWDNKDKDKLIYNAISYCYVYCTLTVKKDELLAAHLFKDKQFILDANILFRLAGINNDSRQKTIQSFIQKSKSIGIPLYYTSETADEIKRVIINKVTWLSKITNRQQPLDLREWEISENDFYSIYMKWCDMPSNLYNDFDSFEKHLNHKIDSVIDELSSVSIDNYEIKNKDDYKEYYASLKEYKEFNTRRPPSSASIKTDINNIFYVRSLRKQYTGTNIWNTKEYLISADQNLIEWSNNTFSGIPLVVLPSVWLSIILRFTGRTSDDYKAFCSFLELRTHTNDNTVDVFELIEALSEKTTNNTLKNDIVKEVYNNMELYTQQGTVDYDLITDLAFDRVLNEYSEEQKKALQEQENKYQNNANIIDKLIEQDVSKRFRFVDWLNRKKTFLAFIAFLFFCFVTLSILLKKWLPYSIAIKILPKSSFTLSKVLTITEVLFTVFLLTLCFFINKLILFLASDDRKQKYRNKRRNFYKSL